MNREYRKGLLANMVKVEQLIAQAEAYSVEAAVMEDATLLDVARQIAELRRILADIERKLSDAQR